MHINELVPPAQAQGQGQGQGQGQHQQGLVEALLGADSVLQQQHGLSSYYSSSSSSSYSFSSSHSVFEAGGGAGLVGTAWYGRVNEHVSLALASSGSGKDFFEPFLRLARLPSSSDKSSKHHPSRDPEQEALENEESRFPEGDEFDADQDHEQDEQDHEQDLDHDLDQDDDMPSYLDQPADQDDDDPDDLHAEKMGILMHTIRIDKLGVGQM